MSNNHDDKTIPREELKFAREQVEKERSHRRDKLWKIFSWTSTLLVAIIGGTVALRSKPQENFEFSWWLRLVLILSVISLVVYAVRWIKYNLMIEESAQEAINKYDGELNIKNVIPAKPQNVGYNAALILLAAAAIGAIICPI